MQLVASLVARRLDGHLPVVTHGLRLLRFTLHCVVGLPQFRTDLLVTLRLFGWRVSRTRAPFTITLRLTFTGCRIDFEDWLRLPPHTRLNVLQLYRTRTANAVALDAGLVTRALRTLRGAANAAFIATRFALRLGCAPVTPSSGCRTLPGRRALVAPLRARIADIAVRGCSAVGSHLVLVGCYRTPRTAHVRFTWFWRRTPCTRSAPGCPLVLPVYALVVTALTGLPLRIPQLLDAGYARVPLFTHLYFPALPVARRLPRSYITLQTPQTLCRRHTPQLPRLRLRIAVTFWLVTVVG